MRKKPRKWTDEDLLADAKKYKTVKEWNANSPNARIISMRRGIYNKATAHMERMIKAQGHWTREAIATEAKKYSNRARFSQGASRAYQLALEFDIIDEVCSHMPAPQKPSGAGYVVYEISFSDGSVYIGITRNPSTRLTEHLKSAGGAVSSKCTELNGEKPQFKMLVSGLTSGEAARKEKETVAKYRKRGTSLLNRAKTGGLGSRQQYTDSEIQALADKCKTRSEFVTKYPGAYGAARSRGILENVCANMAKRIRWTVEDAMADAKQFKNRHEWFHASAGSYKFLEKLELLDKAMPKKTKSWTLDEALKEGKKFSTRTDWQRGSPYSYVVARKAGLVHIVIEDTRQRWTAEKVLIEKRKFKSVKEWASKSPGSYNFWLKNIKKR